MFYFVLLVVAKVEVEVFATKANQVGYRRSKNEIYFSKKALAQEKC